MEVVRDFSYKRGTGGVKEAKDIRNASLEELFFDFYSYQHDGELPEESMSELISFAAEQTRNGSEEESEKERMQDAEKLIAFAGREV